MKFGRSHSISVLGIKGYPVVIEAALLPGLPTFTIVGLPDAAVSESRERIRSAFAAAGVTFPQSRVTVNLSPADTHKSGTGFDLGIAVAIMAAMGGRPTCETEVYIGELGLDGSVRSVRGVLPAALAAVESGATQFYVPVEQEEEAQLSDLAVTGIWHISQVAAWAGIDAKKVPEQPQKTRSEVGGVPDELDMADVRGQDEAKVALEVAAAGGHHILMTGPPGVGKSMLAARLPGILPELTRKESVEVASIQSCLSEFSGGMPRRPPYSAPHHTSSSMALIGGGSIPRPGAVSRAHRGVLFLDEMPEFPASVLQAIREPMESGEVEIHRARAMVRFPARFQLVGAANPCRCGKYLDGPGQCTCSSRDRREYFRRIGGPILDRFDLNIVVRRLSRSELNAPPAEDTSVVAARVADARGRQERRLRETSWIRNADIRGSWLRRNTNVPEPISGTLDNAISHGHLSMRAIDKIFRMAWSFADLAGHESPHSCDFQQAFVLRTNGGFYGG